MIGVARAGSFTSAANHLAISQSALTKSVADVERLLGTAIFDRLPRGVTLTDAGRVFIPRAERIVADTQELFAGLDALSRLETGHVDVGVAPAGFAAFLEVPLARFAHQHRGIQVHVREGVEEDMARGVISGELDLLLGSRLFLDQWTQLIVVSVAPLKNFLIARPDHPLRQIERPELSDIAAYPLVLPSTGFAMQVLIDELFRAGGLVGATPQYVCNHFASVCNLVRATDAISPVVSLSEPAAALGAEFHIIEGVLELDGLELAVGWSVGRQLNAAAEAFLDSLLA